MIEVSNYQIMVKVSKLSACLVAILASLSLPKIVEAESTAKLTVVVDGLLNQKGEVCLRIYENERGFPQSAAGIVQSGCTKVTGASVTKQFYGLKYGTYAVTLFQDENGDKKLNTNFIGIPQEGFGISNNPPVGNSAPKFSNASFPITKDTTIRIGMKYLFER